MVMMYKGTVVRTPLHVVAIARQLRLNLTASEKVLWAELKKSQLGGYRFRCQHPVYRYVLDFYCHSAMLAVEIDGDVHKERKDYDAFRDELLQSIGIKTIRFSVQDVMTSLNKVIHVIREELHVRANQVPLRGI